MLSCNHFIIHHRIFFEKDSNHQVKKLELKKSYSTSKMMQYFHHANVKTVASIVKTKEPLKLLVHTSKFILLFDIRELFL